MLELLRAAGLNAWDYNHVPLAQSFLVPFHKHRHRSPVIDLTFGYEAYVRKRRNAGTEQIKKNASLARRLEREVGPLRFAANLPDPGLLETLLQWKTAQFRRNRWLDLFSIPWIRLVMERIHAARSPDFAGMLSALFAGEELVALHFGMRSATVWHYWFPAYSAAYAKYSPGVMLLLRMADAAPGLGIREIDLGCGEYSYKYRLMNGFVPTAAGSIEPCSTLRLARRCWSPVRKLPTIARRLAAKNPLLRLVRRGQGDSTPDTP